MGEARTCHWREDEATDSNLIKCLKKIDEERFKAIEAIYILTSTLCVVLKMEKDAILLAKVPIS